MEREGLSQADFAKQLGVSQGYLSRVLARKRKPNAELIAGAFRVLNIEPTAWAHNKRPAAGKRKAA